MKASPEHQRRLLELAKADSDMAQLQHLAKHLPEQEHLAAIEQERSMRRATAATAVGALEDAQAELRRLESDSQVVQERRARDEQRMNASSSAKEIAGLEHELATLAARQERLDEELLALMERIDQLQMDADTATKAMREADTEASELLVRRDAARDGLRQRAKEVMTRRNIVVQALPEELVAEYERLRKAHGVGVAELRGRTSTATNETIDPSEYARITKLPADEIAYDPTTGAILVRDVRAEHEQL